MSSRLTVLPITALIGVAVLFAACDGGQDGLGVLFHERLGGDTTAFSDGRNAFELSARNLTNEERRIFEVGDSFFTQNWVTAPASTVARTTGADVQRPIVLVMPQPRREGQAP